MSVRFLTERTGQKMDSADSGYFKADVLAQDAKLTLHAEQLSSINQGMIGLTDRQDEFQSAVTNQVNHLALQMQQVLSPLKDGSSAPTPAMPGPPSVASDHTTPPGSTLRLAPPERFSGDSGNCRSFLVQCELHFAHNPAAFVSDQAKVAFMLSHMSGRAAAWATAEWSRNSPICQSLNMFTQTLSCVFDHSSPSREASRVIMQIKRGQQRVTDYAIDFRTLAADSGWNTPALIDAFMNGLQDSIKDQLAPHELPTDLDSIIAMSIRIDNRLHERQKERIRTSARPPSHMGHSPAFRHPWSSSPPSSASPKEPVPSAAPEEPMQLVSQFSATDFPPRSLTMVHIQVRDQDITVGTLVDSGADESLMDWSFAKRLCIKTVPLTSPVTASALDGKLLFKITHVSEPVQITIDNTHIEEMKFQLFDSALHPLILGYPWLIKHNPIIDWRSGRVKEWGPGCRLTCSDLPRFSTEPEKEQDKHTHKPDSISDYPDLTKVPLCYQDLKEAFNKTRAMSLPPHRPYDCPINLLAGSQIPKRRLYSLSAPEREAMKSYIDSSLKTGLIRPSSSPAAAGFFFIDKKDGTLRPCIDYSPLNEITVKNRYPLPLMSSAFELLQDAKLFTKLDLRNAYHLIRIREGDEWKTGFNTPSGHYEYLVMPFGLCNAPAVFQSFVNDVLRDYLNKFVFVYLDDILIFSPDEETHTHHVRQVLQSLMENQLYCKAEKCEFHVKTISFLGYIISANQIQMDPEKVSAVANWPSPTNRKKVQQFLGFANFYRRFIRNFSGIAAPLHALTSPHVMFKWNIQADEAFQKLKKLFTTAPILTVADPRRQFIVEVDASNDGIGAVLSQRSVQDNKLHPCAFLSRKLTTAERNYDVGNKELLAVLEEWRHWLEGAEQPFLVWTDHKNLEYIKNSKRLNSRQARWSLFFNRFHFVLSYRPGTQNVKPDVLSRLYDPEPVAKEPESILPPNRVVGAVSWPIESVVKQANGETPAPWGCPRNRLFVPVSVRSQVIHWAHTSMLTCHPGVKRTTFMIKQRFWWQAMRKQVAEYVAACTVCARNKTSTEAQMGLLQPLPVPHRPWSHVSMDFVTGLPISEGNTTVLTVVDRFSKMAHFIALSKLPSAKETAEVMLRHVFRIHGFPRDIVSDRGPQFISRFWKEFCHLLGATVSLSSGYHPQSNGQSERINQELETCLRCLVSQNQASWSKHLMWVEYAHNTLPTSATGLTPFQCVHGYQPPLFPANEAEVTVPSAHAMVRRFRRIWAGARRALLRSASQMKEVVDRRRRPAPPYRPGQRVWLATKNLPLHVMSRKLAPRFVGPFPISKMINPVSVQLRLPRLLKVHPTFHVGKIKPVRESSLVTASKPPPPPQMVEGGPVYAVKRLLAVRKRGRGRQFLVDWDGYGLEERTWIPASFIVDPAMIKDFDRDHPEVPGTSGAVPRGGGTVTSRHVC